MSWAQGDAGGPAVEAPPGRNSRPRRVRLTQADARTINDALYAFLVNRACMSPAEARMVLERKVSPRRRRGRLAEFQGVAGERGELGVILDYMQILRGE